jgi:general secretion pathway protein D
VIRPFPRSRAFANLALALALSGCAAQMAYKDGQDLAAQGHGPEGLAKLEEASRLEPGSAKYRMAVLQTRDRLIASEVARAETLFRQGRLDEAESLVSPMVAAGTANDRALAVLRSIAQRRRGDLLMKQARAAADAKDFDAAREKLKSVLLEEPDRQDARELAQRLDDERSVKPAPESMLAAAYRKPITIEFKDAALRSVFEVISRTSGLNFLFDKDVRTDQKTSIFLKNSTIESAVQLTLLTNQLEQRVLDANTVLIYPNTQAKQKDYQPLTVRAFYLGNADAKSVSASLKALLKTRDIVVDDKLNMLIIRDSPDAIRLAEKVVAMHDLPEPEVMLEVEVLEVKRTRLLDLGIRWPSQISLAPLPGTAGAALTLADLRGLNKSRIGATIDPTTVSAQKTDSDANLLANPRIRARNHEKAKILIGERVPNITTTSTSTGFVAESVNYVDVGLKLDVEPTIYLDGDVAIKISLEVSSIIDRLETKAGSIAYQIGTRTAQTVLRLKDGENQVLAGLINDEDRRSANKVPGLGEIPVVGRLFGEQSDDTSKTEIVLSITPHIVRNIRRPDGASIEFDSGTENSLGARAASAAAAAAGPLPAGPVPPRPAVAPGGAASSTTGGTATATAETQAASQLVTSTSVAQTGSTAVASAGVATLNWQGPTQLKVGDTFALQLMMQSDQAVVSVPFALGFDPQVLQVTSVSEGSFLRQGGVQASFANRVDPSGQILITGTRSGETGTSGQGPLATVNFRVIAAPGPQTQVNLLTIAPVGLAGRPISTAALAPFMVQLGAATVGQTGAR